MNENQHKFLDIVHLYFSKFFQSNTLIHNLFHMIMHDMLNLSNISIFFAEKSTACMMTKFHTVFYSL